jgi:hypothetical protein
MPRKPSCRRLHVVWVRVVFRRFASSPTVPSRAVSVRAACCIGARCVFCLACCIIACFIGACYQRALHACCIVSSVHRKRAALAMTHRCVARCAVGCGCAMLDWAKARLLRCIGARCIGSRCIGPCCIGLCCIGLCCIGLCCMLQTRSRPAAHGRAVRCVVSAVHALLDRAKGGLLRWPSGGRMRSCSVLRRRRRARDEQGHRAVRHRGDIGHRSKGACGASAAMRSWGGSRRTGCVGRLQWAWLRRLVRRMAAAWS